MDAAALHAGAVAALAGFHDDYQALVRHADANDTVLVPIRAALPIRPSVARRVTLIGDAVHPMPPFGAAGANTALKDAHTLAALLGSASSASARAEAIGVYEAAMSRYRRPLVRSALRLMTMVTADVPFQAVFRGVLGAVRLFPRSSSNDGR